MTRRCACGGMLQRSDIKKVAAPEYPGGYAYQDTDLLVAHWRCNTCGAVRTQGKRQSAAKEVKP